MANSAKDPKEPGTTTPTDPTAGAGDQGQAAATTPNQGTAVPDQATSQNSGEGGEKKFTQADVDQIIADRLDREKRKAETAAQRAREEAEDKALQENAKYQELADKRQEKIKTLETQVQDLEKKAAELERAEAALVTYRDQLLEGVPDGVRVLLDALPVVDQLAWLTDNRETSQAQNGTTPQAKLPTTPRPSDRTVDPEARRKRAFKVTRL